jgi:hypothetical protein
VGPQVRVSAKLTCSSGFALPAPFVSSYAHILELNKALSEPKCLKDIITQDPANLLKLISSFMQ